MVEFQRTIPILRIFDVEKAREFYVGFLGFAVDWEHRFGENTPAYLQVSSVGLTLHLSEHHGDACPGSTVFVWMTGIEEFHREITVIRTVQELLGHKDVGTTMIYCHVLNRGGRGVVSPLDAGPAQGPG